MTDSIDTPFHLPFRPRFVASVLERLLGLHRMIEYYRQRPPGASAQQFLRFTLSVLGIKVEIANPGALEQAPRTGPLLIIANHPLGGLEGVAIAQLLLAARPDLKVLTNQMLCRIPELAGIFIGVDVLSVGAAQGNTKGVLKAARHLRSGGALLLFPAGRVSAVSLKRRRIEDIPWHRLAGHLALQNRASCLPVYVHGRNSRWFYWLGLVHPRLRTWSLARELINKQGFTLRLTLGDVITDDELRPVGDGQAVTRYLRISTDILGAQKSKGSLNFDPPEALVRLETSASLEDAIVEIEDCLLLSHDAFHVYCAPYGRLPVLMHHIGSAREMTFRAAGEGTGKAVDIDRFDPHYLQLFVWDARNRRIAGGYRIGKVDEIIARYGLDGLYSRSLYRFDASFIRDAGPALEVGRSFVHPDYQRQPLVLDLLWQGIGAFVARNMDYHVLFGAVSISREHSDLARELIADCMLDHFRAEQKLLQKVKPITPLKTTGRLWSGEMLSTLSNIRVLNKLIGRCDPGKTIPVLLRHYLSLNGRFVCFSLNTGFNDSLDGLMMVDLRYTPPKYLRRYLGKAAAGRFIAHWLREPSCIS